ncbi:MAG: Uma2 family endonuclease [Lachnospiraceae bacterium]|nr:Uma2 family endonuclease [Lachnospiraceae bacterium]
MEGHKELTSPKGFTEEDYYDLPQEERVELIDGVFYDMASPGTVHQQISTNLVTSINNHIRLKGMDCAVFHAPYDVKLFPDRNDTIVQPDISVICDPSKLKKNRCEGAPDWVIEIVSPSSICNDYIRKLNLYKDAGVREYWIVNPEEETVTKYMLFDEEFNLKSYGFDEKIPVGICEDFFIEING